MIISTSAEATADAQIGPPTANDTALRIRYGLDVGWTDDKQVVLAPPAGGTVAIPLEEIEERILSPVSSMPPMAKVFTPEEISDLVAYLVSLKLASQPPPIEAKARGKAPCIPAD